jgi:hypothetical protein
VASIYKEVPHVVFEAGADQIFHQPVVSEADRLVLRSLGERLAELATSPLNSERRRLWQRMNDLEAERPMVWITEIPWHEMESGGELTMRTASPFCRRIEAELRQTIYKWEHMQADMVIEPVIACPLVVENTGIGFAFEEDVLRTTEENEVVSHRFHAQVREEHDIEKIRVPAVTHREDLSRMNLEAYCDIFGGILPVQPRGVTGFWFAPWDDIVRLTGVEEVMIDLATRADYVHALVGRLVDVYLAALDQYENLGLLSSNAANIRIGSGAYGYTKDLPAQSEVLPSDSTLLWGSATAQIFAGVSPAMHEEFALAYERPWLARWGLTYYGCCEPLDRKIDILRSIPNLRKVSVSPWADSQRAAEALGKKYVFSFKPSPAVLAKDRWNPQEARRDLVETLEKTRREGCAVEIIMKDISTVRGEPWRLWEWASIAAEVAQESA